MNWGTAIPVLVLLSSLVPGLIIFFLDEERQRTRTVLNLSGAIVKIGLVGIMLWGVYHQHHYETRFPLLPGLDLALRADALAMLLTTLSAGLWLLTTIFAVGYLEGSPHRSRFFGFFSLCVTATMGIALANNLLTFFVFYELLTLTTYPLVIHRGTARALQAGRTYLVYTLTGSAVLLIGIVWLYIVAGPVSFTEGGALAPLGHVGHEYRGTLIAIFSLLIAGIGVKAALVPLHGWLPIAMVAPAPVSALLHAVAVVKAGAFGIVRVVYDVFGIRFAADLGVTTPLALLASLTIVYGSLRALAQDDLKRRLAYSTVSQVSYIVLGIATPGPIASIGGIVHLVHQGIMKITLFFCAGNLAETLGIHRISEMNGVGRRMPWTMTAFTIGALGMIGVPPMAGFISKWHLGMGGVEAGQGWVIAVLAASSLLNAAYFLPILHTAWFREPEGEWEEAHPGGRFEADWRLLLPSLATAALVIAVGVFANTIVSPLTWAKLIAAREYQP
jgi:multicomponent Na+:H+ antiporter subunit D